MDFDEALARQQLPEIYLRGLECRVMGPTGEVNLCEGYQSPTYVLPDWVKRVQDRDGF
ncbi:MAG: hypothetical protein ACI9VR_003316 [Cognaticolwellia sp.]